MLTPVTRSDSQIGQLHAEYISLVNARNISGMLDLYTDDCLLISMLTDDRQPRYVRGHEQLRPFLEEHPIGLEDVTVTYTQWAETDHTMMTVEELSGRSSEGSAGSLGLYDNWYLRDGKIALHLAGVVRYPDGTYADGSGFAAGTAPEKREPPETPLGRMYREHIGFIKAKDVEGILGQYDQNAVLIGTLTEGRKPRYIHGRDELRSFFNANFTGLNALKSKIDQWAEDGRALMIVESIDLELKDGTTATMSFYDNWVLQDGRIVVHFAGVVRYPDGSYA